jgi:hypothetical protein
MAQDIRLMWPSTYDPITDTHVLCVGKGLHQRIYKFTSEQWESLTEFPLAFKEQEMARHPKYTAEAARLKPPTKPDAYTWVDPRGLSYLDDAAARRAADEKIRKEYDDLFWSTTTGGKFTTATVASPSSWDYVPYEFAKKELPMNPFLDKVVKMEYVGSRITCNPAPTDTDEDVLLLTDDLETLIGDCIEVGFTRDGDTKASYPEGFVSLRNGSMNFIVTDDEEFYKKFMLATHVCKSLNLMEKNNRITVFQAILYGKEYEYVPF